ncbi:MAG: sn-glycerol-3-phosphate ABC transporter ATP-binding protein UgpC [Anaerococcus sp.]|nr:sn-glycerol-3-phosphate ABC transporter ATP-binding protein UgpC [Anaerococcus sp.]
MTISKFLYNEEGKLATLSLRNIDKIYPNGVQAVYDFNLDIADKEFIVFVGPSGCGKSTTLRMIAGLEEISSGELYINDKLMNDVNPKDRNIAMVFQNYALYPHMSVYDNMAFGLQIQKKDKKEIEEKVKRAAEMLELLPYLDRKPAALSGGQRQRVALGRAIVRQADIFLMDEPLSNLDAKLRSQMRTEISRIHDSLNTTTIYVTHDQTEAMSMASRIVVMKDGYIQQIGSPEEIYDYPENVFVANFIGSPPMNFFKGEMDQGKLIVGNDSIDLSEKNKNALKTFKDLDKDLIVGIRPEAFSLNDLDGRENYIKAQIVNIEMLGDETIIYAEDKKSSVTIEEDGSNKIAVKVSGKFKDRNVGDSIKLFVNFNDIHLFDSKTQKRIN